MSEDGRRAHRAAGRAVAAVLVGAHIESVSIDDGTTIASDEDDAFIGRPNADILAEIFFVLTGVAAQQAYSFGFPPGDSIQLMPRPDDPAGMHDVEVADELSLELAEADCPGLAIVWRYAAELVCQSDIWAAIEAVANALSDRSLDHAEVMRLCLTASERKEV